LTNKTALVWCLCTHIKGHSQLVEIQHWTLHSTKRLTSKFARFVSDWKRLELYGCRTVYASPQPQTLTALKHRLRESWRSISLSTVQNLIGSIPDRLKAVIRNKGDTVLY